MERSEPEDPDLLFDPPKKHWNSSATGIHATRANSFGSGALTMNIAGADAARSTLLLADGRIVAVGASNNGTDNDFTIVRYLPDGSLDTSFATDGTLIDATGSKNDIIHSIVLQTDGTYLAVGRGFFYNYDFAINRYLSSGSLDTSFHTDGKVNTEVWDNGDFARAGAIQTDGKILAAGFTWLFGQYNFALVRYLTNGALDTTFDSDGKAWLRLASSDNGALAMRLETDGTVVLAGPSFNGSDWDFGVVRFASNGTLDSSFSTDGKDTVAVAASDDKVYSIQISTSGTILLGGYANVSDLDYALVRYLSSGALDTAFYTNGKLTHSIFAGAGDDDVIGTLAIESTEVIIAGGYSETGGNNDFSIARYLTDGTFDTSFSTDGKSSLAIGSAEDTGNFLNIQTNGQIFLAGQSNTGSDLDFAIARFSTNGAVTVSGSLDLSFGTSGSNTLSIGTSDAPRSLVLQTDGRLVVWGNSNVNFAAVRYFANGTVDTSFHTDGVATFDVSGSETGVNITIQTDGKMIGMGYSTDILFVRVLSDGNLDTTFSTDGKQTLSVSGSELGFAVEVQTDGNIVIVGGDGTIDAVIARYTTSGVLDTSFLTDGVRVDAFSGGNDYHNNLLILSTGQILTVGTDTSGGNANISRYETDGNLDTSFNTDGWNSINMGAPSDIFKGVILDVDPTKYIASGDGGNSAYIAKFLSDGNLDTSFHTDGKNGAPSTMKSHLGRPLMVESGLIYTAGDDTADFTIARWLTSGRIDTSFHTDGVIAIDVSSTDKAYSIVKLSDGRLCATGIVNSADFGIVCLEQ